MRAPRTAFARFIDISALWSLCLAAWFYYLFARMGRMYPAMLMAVACSGATIALAMLVKGRMRRRRRGDALAPAEVRALCEHIALKSTDDALENVAAWLTARGRYAKCYAADGAIHARRANGSEVCITLITAWPGLQVSADALISAWRRCCGAKECAVASTAPFGQDALSLAKRLGIRLIAPEALAKLMHDALPLCAEAAPRTRISDTVRAIFGRLSAARLGAWALGLCVSGRILGLEYCRAAGLACAALWVVCASLPKPPRAGAWP